MCAQNLTAIVPFFGPRYAAFATGATMLWALLSFVSWSCVLCVLSALALCVWDARRFRAYVPSARPRRSLGSRRYNRSAVPGAAARRVGGLRARDGAGRSTTTPGGEEDDGAVDGARVGDDDEGEREGEDEDGAVDGAVEASRW